MYNHTANATNKMHLTSGMLVFIIIYSIIIGGCCIGGCYYSVKYSHAVKILPDV